MNSEHLNKKIDSNAFLKVLLILLLSKNAQAESYFPVNLLADDIKGEIADLSMYDDQHTQFPGVYEVNIFVNDERLFSKQINFFQKEKLKEEVENKVLDNNVEQQNTSEYSKDNLEILANRDDEQDIENTSKIKPEYKYSQNSPSGSLINLTEELNEVNNSSKVSELHESDEIDTQLNSDEKSDSTGLTACINPKLLLELGVDVDKIPNFSNLDVDSCVDLEALIPNAYSIFDFERMNLKISIPQISLSNKYKGWVSPDRWDDGINAAFINYNFNASASNSQGGFSDNQNGFLSLNTGLNIGPWRLRDNSTWVGAKSNINTESRWQHLQTYVERSVIPLKSSLMIGDNSTNSMVFDSLPIRGIQISSDENMYPSRSRGYAPVVRGTVETNSEVSIRQNGNLIYQQNVAPGDFEITDISSLSSNGDLNVTVKEANGKSRNFIVPYATVPTLLRDGRKKYSLALGQFNGGRAYYDTPFFAQGSLIWGLPFATVYGGTQLSSEYQSFRIGSGFNLGYWGALSTDFTHAISHLKNGDKHQGYSLGMSYAREINKMGTNLQIAGYRYSSEGFYQLQDTANNGAERDDIDELGGNLDSLYYDLDKHRRQRFLMSVNQRIKGNTNFYVSGIRESFWGTSATRDSLRAGLSGKIKKINYGLSYENSRDNFSKSSDEAFLFSLTMPFGGEKSRTYGSYFTRYDPNSVVSHSLNVTGSALERQNLNWGIASNFTEFDNANLNVYSGYAGSYGRVNMGVNYSPQNDIQSSFGYSGSAVFHRDGITLGQSLGTTNILVSAPGAASVPVSNGNGIKTDWRGYTIQPFASEFNENLISLDVTALKDTVEIENSTATVVPTKGAIVRAEFNAKTGYRGLFTLLKDGKVLPFGTSVAHANGNNIVGEDGEVYLTGLQPQGQLKAQWGTENTQQCVVEYDLKDEIDKKSPIIMVDYECI
ncbi:fimbria/pilus outer membrane usher protein [Acinetobacter terrestris]|uniref:fimbria/pilus outer membrane usher protein n=1 Tax=Acinetobacter terrestris TaxID=2529843 RepID=UPI003525E621